MSAIEILGLEKTYPVGFWRKRPKRALKPLSLTIEEGEIFGFLRGKTRKPAIVSEKLARGQVVIEVWLFGKEPDLRLHGGIANGSA